MPLGLKKGTVALEPHRVEWEVSAQKLIEKLKCVLKCDIIDAQHIGSTSIKTICAKPIVDIVVGVSSLEKIMRHNDTLAENGVFFRREDHPGQLLYVCGDLKSNIHTHYIHAVLWGQENWNNYLNMRDYLNTHEDKAKEYSMLKQCLAEMYPDDRIAYTVGKSELIASILECAEKWRKQCS